MTDKAAENLRPRTEAGRAWYDYRARYEGWFPVDARRDETLAAILAIEAEAATLAAPAGLREAMLDSPFCHPWPGSGEDFISVDAALALVDGVRETHAGSQSAPSATLAAPAGLPPQALRDAIEDIYEDRPIRHGVRFRVIDALRAALEAAPRSPEAKP